MVDPVLQDVVVELVVQVLQPLLQRLAVAGLELGPVELAADRDVVERGPGHGGQGAHLVGALREVLGFKVSTLQRHQVWSSDEPGKPQELAIDLQQIGDGPGVAVVVSVAAEATADVTTFLERSPVGRVLALAPASGARAESVPDGPTAAALALAMRDAVRAHLDGTTDEIHLFLAAPAGLALLLGHRWNALRPTVVYEHLGAGRGYQRTSRVSA